MKGTEMLDWLSVNVGHDPVFRAKDIARGGFNSIRIVLQKHVDLFPYIAECHQEGLEVHGQIAHESLASNGKDMSPDEGAILYANFYCVPENPVHLDSLSVLNEADADPNNNDGSWCLPPNEADTFLAAFLYRIRSVNRDIPLYAVGTVTGQPSYVRALDQSVLRQYTALDIHAYAQWPNTVAEMIGNYDEFGMPYIVHEFGWPHPDPATRGEYIYNMVKTFENMGNVLGAGLYCWDLSQHPSPFGVVDHGRFTAAIPYIQRLGYSPTGAIGPLPPSPPLLGQFIREFDFEKWWKMERNIIGEPIGFDETNVAPQWQMQPTTKGIIQWVAGKGLAFVTYPDKNTNEVHIYRWDGNLTHSIQVK